MKTREASLTPVFFFGFILLAIDQVSKALVIRKIPLGDYVPVLGHFFGFSHIRNKGAAWGFLSEHAYGSVFFTLIALLAAFFLVWGILRLSRHRPAQIFLSMMLAGNLGNLLDRLLRGSVVDFLSFHFGSYAFPSFNIADSCIVLGSVLLFILLLRQSEILDQLLPASFSESGEKLSQEQGKEKY